MGPEGNRQGMEMLTSGTDNETMIVMLRALVVTALFIMPSAASGQPLSVLHVSVTAADAEGKATPLPRHALLISDNPASAPPRRIVTRLDGTADVSLPPGNYTVESERSTAFQGKAYLWTQIVDIFEGRDTTLVLTADNAEVEPAGSAATTATVESELNPSALLIQWQDSLVRVWTPTTHASGFVIDARGLVATNQRGIGTATSVEVQLSQAVKVEGNVLATDPVRDVAVLWIDPKVLASVRPVPLGCGLQPKPSLDGGQEVSAIGTSLHDQKDVTPGTVTRVESRTIAADFALASGSAGGPVFAADGRVVGMTRVADGKDDGRRAGSGIASVEDVCEVVASAEKKMAGAAPPHAHLPVEPARPVPAEALKDAVLRRAGSLNPYQMSSSDFDIALITPVMVFGAQYRPERPGGRPNDSGTRAPDTGQPFVRPLMDFSNWSEYVADVPPVLLVRVTPRLVEGFWMTVARAAARTRGVSLPPIKHVRSGFSRMRAFCGSAEVTPIHPFKLEQRISDSEAIYEGLYVFDLAAFGPQCGTVKLTLYSEKEPEKGDTRVVDPKLIQQVWRDFAPYREPN
jgi:S1-C subfamily serine protease